MVRTITITFTSIACIWEWFTTTLAISNIFEANNLFKYIFCGIAALAFSCSLLLTPEIMKLYKKNTGAAILATAFWCFFFCVSVYTTLIGNGSVILGIGFGEAMANVSAMFEKASLIKVALIVATTLFVSFSAMILGGIATNTINLSGAPAQ